MGKKDFQPMNFENYGPNKMKMMMGSKGEHEHSSNDDFFVFYVNNIFFELS